MDELFESCPPMDFAALEEEILGGVLRDDNYLYYRTLNEFSGWPGTDERQEPAWELYCTACHQRYVIAKSRGFRVASLESCPDCGAAVSTKRWLPQRSKLNSKLLYYKFQRGEGRRVWLHAYAVTHEFCPAPGYERLEFDELARYEFEDGAARKWTCTFQYFGKTLKSEWTRRKRVTKTVWKRDAMNRLPPYPTFIGAIDAETIRGSCLEYSQLDRAISDGFDIPEYLDFYLKNPMIEYLWKFGLQPLLWEAVMVGHRAGFRAVVNLRARRPRDLLPGLTVSEVRKIADGRGHYCRLGFIRTYRRLKERGEAEDSATGFAWADAVSRCEISVQRARERGVDGKRLRSYIERQSRRSGRGVASLLSDYSDYLWELARLNVTDGDLFPPDLQASHERLSVRLRTLMIRQVSVEKNRLFRYRRRLYAWMRWRHNGLFIRPVDSMQEILREGEMQRNCVASYADRHAMGRTVILLLRRQSAPAQGWHTVELNPQTLEVRQCRRRRNDDAAPEAEEFIAAWTARLKNIRSRRETA